MAPTAILKLLDNRSEQKVTTIDQNLVTVRNNSAKYGFNQRLLWPLAVMLDNRS
jgi:hypothetical protein